MLRTLAAALLAALASSGALAGDPVAAPTPAGGPGAARAVEAPAAVAALAAPPAAARIGEPTPGRPAEGRVESQGARVEVMSKPLRAGETLELPEGYLRVEEEGVEDREVGSFSIVPARTLRPATLARAEAGGRAVGPAAPPAAVEPAAAPPAPVAERPCRRERAAYLRELWKESGIEEVADPDAVIEGLGSGGGAATGFYWFALATDPFRPLAWSSALRARADALARCVRHD